MKTLPMQLLLVLQEVFNVEPWLSLQDARPSDLGPPGGGGGGFNICSCKRWISLLEMMVVQETQAFTHKEVIEEQGQGPV
jgi:hypothetical protein